MKIVNDQKSNEFLYMESKKFILENKNDEFNFTTELQPIHNKYSNINNKWIGPICFLTFFLIVPIVWFLIRRHNYSKELNDAIKISLTPYDYSKFLSENTYFDNFISYNTKNKSLLQQRIEAVNLFPFGSIIDNEKWSDVYHFDLYSKYKLETQQVIINYHYYVERVSMDSKGNLVTRRVRVSEKWSKSITEINIEPIIKEEKYLISVNHRIKYPKYKLENNKFNKSFSIRTTNKIASNMIFTPLVQEKMLKTNGISSFIINTDLISSNSYFGGFYLTNDFIFKIKDFKKGIDNMKEILSKEFSEGIINLNRTLEPLMILPIWDKKKK